MTTTVIDKYRKYRTESPMHPAKHALAWAKLPDAEEPWESHGDESYKREVDGFTVILKVETESIFPECNKNGETDYGSYVQERGSQRWGWDGEWNGNWPEPQEFPPLGLPYTSIRYSGPGWVQGESGGYFIPDHIEEQYDYYRRAGQSKSVAWDMTKEWVEGMISDLFHAPLSNCYINIKVYKEDIELGSAGIGTDIISNNEGEKYIFQCVEEHGLVDEAIEQARDNIVKLAHT